MRTPHMPRGAPHGRPRGPVRVASCHASAPPAPRAGQPWLCHVASVPCRIHALVPRATSARCLGPLAMSSPAVSSPLFRGLNKENFIKKSIKNQLNSEKGQKFHKFITLNIQLLFNPNFLHWITNFFLFKIMSFKIYF